MKDIKNARLELRLTQEEKDKIKEYAEKRDMSASEFVRYACQRIFSQEKTQQSK